MACQDEPEWKAAMHGVVHSLCSNIGGKTLVPTMAAVRCGTNLGRDGRGGACDSRLGKVGRGKGGCA